MKRCYQFFLIPAIVVIALYMPVHAGVLLGTSFTYQGELSESGELVDGPRDMTFRLFNLPNVGVQIGGDFAIANVPVVDGRFTVMLDFGDAFTNTAARFLEIEVEGVTLSPRQQITNVPVSLFSQDSHNTRGLFVSDILDVGIGTQIPAAQLHILTADPTAVYAVNSRPSGVSHALRGEAHSTSGGGVFGHASAGSGFTVGAAGRSDSPDGFGVFGLHSAESGTAAGVMGVSDSEMSNAVGVHGRISATSAGSFSAAVRGENKGTGFNGIGVWGSHDGSGWGVYGSVAESNGVAGYFSNPAGRALVAEGIVGIGVNTPLAQLHVREDALTGLDAGDLVNDDIVIEDNDAILGLFSNANGNVGSGIALREMSGGALGNSWGIIRETSGGGEDLRFTFGSDPGIANNGTMVSMGEDRRVDIRGQLVVSGTDTPLPGLAGVSTLLVREQGIDGEAVMVMELDGDDTTGIFVDFRTAPGSRIGSIFTTGDGEVIYGAFTGAHYAVVPEGVTVSQGALVCMTGHTDRLESDFDRSEPVYEVEPSSRANDPACLGAYLAPSENAQTMEGAIAHAIAAVGNSDLMVIDYGRGDIQPGDLLISSDVEGYAMQDNPERFATGYAIARAAQGLNWESVEPAADGRRRAKISVLFDATTRQDPSRMEAMQAQLARQRVTIDALEQRLMALEARMPH